MSSAEGYITKYFGLQYKEDTPGMGITVIRNNVPVYEEYVGLANMEYKIPVCRDTVFNVGSISKQFTALAIFQLMKKGKLDEKDEITTYVPELKDYAKGVLIYHLIHHSSGIADYNDLLYLKARNNALHATNDEVIQLLSKETQLKFVPGNQFDYSNSNYVLLAVIIERITGNSFGMYMSQNMFNKADMAQTIIFNEKQPIVPNRAYGYEYLNDAWKCWYVDSLTTGCTNVMTSMGDMIKYDSYLSRKDVISDNDFERMIKPGTNNENEPIWDWCGGYGFGWMIQTLNSKKIICHSGGEAGFNSLYIRFYEKQLSVVILTNTNGLVWDKAYEIADGLCEKYMDKS